MKICTFNVNSIKARKDLVLDWLDHRGDDIDVLCLQELKGTEENFPLEDFQKKGYHCVVSGQKTYNGVAVCSRIPLECVNKGFGSEKWDQQKRLVEVLFGGIHLINVYVPQGDLPGEEKFQYKQDWYKELKAYLSKRYTKNDPLIIVGDFNVASDDRDVFSPQKLEGLVGTLPEEREAFQRLLDWGLEDTYRSIHRDKTEFTWWDYRTAGIWRDEGMRIDYILCTPALLPRVTEISVDLWPRKRRIPTPSDHAPLIATLEI